MYISSNIQQFSYSQSKKKDGWSTTLLGCHAARALNKHWFVFSHVEQILLTDQTCKHEQTHLIHFKKIHFTSARILTQDQTCKHGHRQIWSTSKRSSSFQHAIWLKTLGFEKHYFKCLSYRCFSYVAFMCLMGAIKTLMYEVQMMWVTCFYGIISSKHGLVICLCFRRHITSQQSHMLLKWAAGNVSRQWADSVSQGCRSDLGIDLSHKTWQKHSFG